ncbi:MAG: ABC transporter ATP-binding protein [Deltaproteobacteria bacterium]|nr:ABC transporter ATP-binding protein [Deltaproteobacteria bacterium]MBW2254019.1 ABC transporter ATP-binding protein [Deltaproteobacteria bacterium]
MIEARGLTRRFGTLTAVDGVDLCMDGRGVLGFLGPNGAGKTTTMRMLTGFLSMTAGSARVAGFDVFDQPLEVKARVGYLPEAPPLYPELTVRECLRFVARLHGLRGEVLRQRMDEVIARTGLEGMQRRLLGQLSRGFQQRVGLAQTLVHDPPVLLLDEPTTGLDPAQRAAIRDLIGELGRERTVLLSTHLLQDVEILCRRIAVIHQGRIVGDGTLAELAAAVGLSPGTSLEAVYLALVRGTG